MFELAVFSVAVLRVQGGRLEINLQLTDLSGSSVIDFKIRYRIKHKCLRAAMHTVLVVEQCYANKDCDSPSEVFALDGILLCRGKDRDIWWYKTKRRGQFHQTFT